MCEYQVLKFTPSYIGGEGEECATTPFLHYIFIKRMDYVRTSLRGCPESGAQKVLGEGSVRKSLLQTYVFSFFFFF